MAKIMQIFDLQGKSEQKIGKIVNGFKESALSGTAPAGLFSTVGDYSVEQDESVLVATIITTTHSKQRKKPYQKPPAVKQLEQLADKDNQRRHPHTPVHYLAKSKYRDDTANGLTKCIIDYIRLNGGQAERVNTMGIPKDTRQTVTDVLGRTYTIGGINWRPGGSTNGSADISATIEGRSVKIEVKIGRDEQSEAQKEYQRRIEAAGGLYYIAHDFTDFYSWYSQTFKEGVR